MNRITEQNRIDTYRNANEDIRQLYVSDDLSRQIDVLYATYNLTQPFREVSQIVGDTILGFYKIADMPRLFQQKLGVSADESQRMTSSLIEILAPVVKREEQEVTAKKNDLKNLAQTFAQPAPATNSTPTPVRDASAPETFIEKVEPIRTMEGDISRIHGYGAQPQYQEDIPKDEHPKDTK